jgi:hypothetical protein
MYIKKIYSFTAFRRFSYLCIDFVVLSAIKLLRRPFNHSWESDRCCEKLFLTILFGSFIITFKTCHTYVGKVNWEQLGRGWPVAPGFCEADRECRLCFCIRTWRLHWWEGLKGKVARDFRPLVFSMNRTHIVHYHIEGSMKLNARILLLVHMDHL